MALGSECSCSDPRAKASLYTANPSRGRNDHSSLSDAALNAEDLALVSLLDFIDNLRALFGNDT